MVNAKAPTREDLTKALEIWSDEEYREIATRIVENAARNKFVVLGYQLDLGKWLLASLLLLNAGALVAITNLDTQAANVFRASGAMFVGGVTLAFISGFFAWVNSAIVSDILDDMDDAFIVVNRASWPMHNASKARWVGISSLLSIASGFASVGMFAWGVVVAGAALG